MHGRFAGEVQAGVNVVGHQPYVRMALEHVGQAAQFVGRVDRARRVAGRSVAGEVCTATGVPPLTSAMSGYDTQYGAGMMTSSAACTVAASAVKINCLAPTPTISSSNP
ncbi:hypothetical protein G6F58_013369 [Rhizopus delemar]|nr:hypothetical protein G6F58_013369 [Rhizopus delemar]